MNYLKIKYTLKLFLFLTFLSNVTIISSASATNNNGNYFDMDGLVINEIAPSGTNYLDETGKREDWLELYNNSDEAINLNGLFLSDDEEDLQKWQITIDSIIPPGGFVVFFADKDPEEGPFHTNFKLKSSGETLIISAVEDDEIEIIDSISYGSVDLNITYGRQIDGTENFVLFGMPTPGQSNNDALLFLSTPTFSVPSGIYTDTQTVRISHVLTDVTIHYLTGGYLPADSFLIYENPFELSHNTVIRAVAVKEGYKNSAVANGTFLFQSDMPNGEMPNMEVICLTTDPPNFFSDEYGNYVTGTNGRTGYCSLDTANYNHDTRDWERPVNIKLFLKDGSNPVDVNGGSQIGGACSRLYPQRGLNLYLRQRYYGDKHIDYPLFDKRNYTKFSRLKLRNSGQDFLRIGFRDALIQNTLMGKLDLEFLATHSVLAFINEDFWGVYNLREYYAGEYFESRFGVKENEIDVIKNPGMGWEKVKLGSSEDFLTLKEFVRENDLSDASNYNHVATQLDINNFLNFWSSMIYLANVDWPGNNNYIWRAREEGGRWRYLFQDTDASANSKLAGFASSYYNSLECATIDIYDIQQPQCKPEATLFFRKLLQNQQFRDEYIQRTCSFIELLFDADHFVNQIDSMQNLFEPNFEAEIERWDAIADSLQRPVWGGGSIWSWHDWIDKFREFFVDRPDIMRSQINDKFELDSTFLLQINIVDTTHGMVLINRNEMRIPEMYEGTYFKNIPIRIKAVPDEGFHFVRWEETGETNPTIDFVANEDATLTPIFDIIIGIKSNQTTNLTISPNPANSVIYFSIKQNGKKSRATIINTVGQTVMDVDLSKTTGIHTKKLDISGLQSGIYTLMIVSGNTTKIGRFVVK